MSAFLRVAFGTAFRLGFCRHFFHPSWRLTRCHKALPESLHDLGVVYTLSAQDDKLKSRDNRRC